MTATVIVEVVLDLGSHPDVLEDREVEVRRVRNGQPNVTKTTLQNQVVKDVVDRFVQPAVDLFRVDLATREKVSQVQVRSVVAHVDDDVAAVK